jgi:Putative zincin peptidase
MKITRQELVSSGYQLDAEINHNDLLPFLTKQFRQTNPFSIFYWVINMLSIGLIIFFMITEKRLPFFESLMQVFSGVLVFFILLLPFHELIHGLFYKICGAPKVSFKAEWRKMIFYCVADGFVVNGNTFLLIVLAPFLVISTVLVIAMFLLSASFFYLLFGAFILHTGGCFGDFGLASYFYNKRNQQPVTYDDAGSKKSYFFVKPDSC